MENLIAVPGKIRKRANKACLACRARKVRCDVSQRGRPCMNCFLDSEACVVVSRASKRLKPTDEDTAGDQAVEDAGTVHLHKHGLGNSRVDIDEQAASHASMDGISDAGSYERETVRAPTSGFSAINASSGGPGYQALERSSPRQPTYHASRPEVPQHHRPSAKPRTQQLEWAGEQSTLFGSDVMYSHYSFVEARNLPNVLPQDISYLEMQGCFRLPKKSILDEFVKHYFLHVHPLLPFLDEGDFWEGYGSPPAEDSHPPRHSLLVLRAMLFAACAYVSRTRIRALGYPDMRIAREALYRRAKLLFDFGAESSPVAIAQTALLLSSWSPSGSHCAQNGSFWLNVAIQQARVAGAHRCMSLYGESGPVPQSFASPKRRNMLKRLWWCVVLNDRVLSLSFGRPMQVSRLHLLSQPGTGCPLGVVDFGDELERSRVYNPGAKTALIEIFIKLTELAVALTDLLAEALPLDKEPHWQRRFSEQEKDSIETCKSKMALWYEKTSSRIPLPPKDPLETVSDTRRSEPAAVPAHDSVALYTNYLGLLYLSATLRLRHHEYLRMVEEARYVDSARIYPPKTKSLIKTQREMQDAAFGVVWCLKKLTKDRLSRWLPLNSLACISLPLVISIVDVKTSPRPGPKLNLLHDLYESVTAYQPQVDTTDWVSDAVRKMLELAGLDRAYSISDAQSAPSDPVGPHPSLFLRLAMAATSKTGRGSFLGEDSPVTVNLRRLLDPDLMSQIASILSTDSKASHTQPARSITSDEQASSYHDHAIQQRIAAWSAQDQALSAVIGMVSTPSLATVDARPSHGAPAAQSVKHMESTSAARDLAERAFSRLGDDREARLLETFAFEDGAPRASGGIGQVDWLAQEHEQRTGQFADAQIADTSSMSPVAAQSKVNGQEGRLDCPEQFWNERF